jgi:hypothetical protein
VNDRLRAFIAYMNMFLFGYLKKKKVEQSEKKGRKFKKWK